MTEPTTAAGRRLLDALHDEGDWPDEPLVCILAIEAEAAAVGPDCECGEPRSAGIHDPIRTWVNDPNKLHAFRASSLDRLAGIFPNGYGCNQCDGTGFMSDDLFDRLEASGIPVRENIARNIAARESSE